MYKKIAVSNRKIFFSHQTKSSTTDFVNHLAELCKIVDFIILREKDLSLIDYKKLASTVINRCNGKKTQIILHSHIDCCHELNYKKIHLPLPIFTENLKMLKDFEKIRYKKDNSSEKNYQLEDPEEDYRKTHETKYRCRDGHYVRSKIEREIDNFLFENRIWHEYEKEEINLENNERFYVDFYLIDYQIYIEHFGLTGNKAYDDKSERKNKYFIENKKRFIYTQSSDESNIEERLIRKIRELEHREKIKILK